MHYTPDVAVAGPPRTSRKAGWRLTREQSQALLAVAMRALSRRPFLRDVRLEIRRALVRMGHVPTSRTLWRWVRRAQRELDRRHGRERRDHWHESVVFFDSVIRDMTVPLKVRMEAQCYIDRLCGFAQQELAIRGAADAPTEAAVSGVSAARCVGGALLAAVRAGVPQDAALREACELAALAKEQSQAAGAGSQESAAPLKDYCDAAHDGT